MFGRTVHTLVLGLKTFVAARPRCAAMCPPTTKIRPSPICSIAPQKILVGAGTEMLVLPIGSHTMALRPKDWLSDIKTLPLGRSAECTATSGKETVPDQAPYFLGSGAELGVKVA